MIDLHLLQAQSLYQSGRLEEAVHGFEQCLRTNPRSFEALHWLMVSCFQLGQFEKAERYAGDALQLDPLFFDGIRIRAMSLMQLKRHEEALQWFERAVLLKPDHIESHLNRATELLELKRFDEALTEFDRVVAFSPANAIAWNNRGSTLLALERLDEAVASYERALAIQPDLATARDNRLLTLFHLRKLSRMPAHTAREMFDEAALRYDAMMEHLEYRSHLHLRGLADRILPRRAAPWHILDLGCGTGLAGDAFKDMAMGGRLDGIDLAPRMIDAARARGIYDDLILGDLETALAAPGSSYDLIISADTMVYLGDLAPAFKGVANRLERAGFFLFACEAKEGDGWEQTAANRFGHSERYLREEATRARLSFVGVMECILRREGDHPVAGYATALRKPGCLDGSQRD